MRLLREDTADVFDHEFGFLGGLGHEMVESVER